jgi:hypothetical protein
MKTCTHSASVEELLCHDRALHLSDMLARFDLAMIRRDGTVCKKVLQGMLVDQRARWKLCNCKATGPGSCSHSTKNDSHLDASYSQFRAETVQGITIYTRYGRWSNFLRICLRVLATEGRIRISARGVLSFGHNLHMYSSYARK